MLKLQPRHLAFLGLLATIAPSAFGQCSSTCAPDGKQTSGATYRVCMPQPGCYNGNLVVFAPGFVDPYEPVKIPEDQLTLGDGTSIAQLLNGLGFAFATTSFSRNGLNVTEGVRDLRQLVDIFKETNGAPQRVYVVGPSQGGLITAKSIETYPEVYSGGLAACGPIGNFRAQINYLGNFRVIFNYMFPGLVPGDVMEVPEAAIANWTTMYEPRIRETVRRRPEDAADLIRAAKVPILNEADIEDAIVRVAWYSVFATNDARRQLGGQPFDNVGKWYSGTRSDFVLNLLVPRISADPQAIAALESYETSGVLAAPLVTMHTTADPVVPYWHEMLYDYKAIENRSNRIHTNLPVIRFGHCQFNAGELLFGFWVLLAQTAGSPLAQEVGQQVAPSGGLALVQ